MDKEKMMEIVTQYKENEAMRNSFFELAKQVHGLDFSGWYQNGYWGDSYSPYSIWMDNAIVANVSVNEMAFRTEQGIKHYIQLGTVMTKPEYRNRGLIRTLMERIEEDYAGKTEDYYLFANDTVLEFYPKFGYKKVVEWQPVKKVVNTSKAVVKKVAMETKEDWDNFAKIIEGSILNSEAQMVNNIGLYMFYLSQFMKNDVYSIEAEHAYVVAELENGILNLIDVFAKKQVDLAKIIEAFGTEVTEVKLHFIPLDMNGFTLIPIQEEDLTTFVKGDGFAGFEASKTMFPELSHA